MSSEHGWALGTTGYDNPWIQVDLGTEKTLVKIVTKGRPSDTWVHWVKTYKLGYNILGNDFEFIQLSNGEDKVFVGSFDSYTVVEHCLNNVLAVKVRMYPQTWHGTCIVLWELFALM